jgi:hypothetical protein
MSISILDIERLAANYAGRSPEEVISLALKTIDNIAISFSGAEDVLLIDMAVKTNPDVKVFSLDTGRLHPETYRYLDQVRKHYGIQLEIVFPESAAVEALVLENPCTASLKMAIKSAVVYVRLLHCAASWPPWMDGSPASVVTRVLALVPTSPFFKMTLPSQLLTTSW